MSKPTNIPRDKFVVGGGLYSSSLALRAKSSSDLFEIAPAPMPVFSLSALAGTILALGFSMSWFLWDKRPHVLAILIVGFSFLTAVVSVSITAAIYRSQQSKGPVFHYNKITGEVSLPDCKVVFPADCRFIFVLINSPFYSASPASEREKVAELQLIVDRGGNSRRFVLARAQTVYVLKKLALEIAKHVPFPIHLIQHKGFLNPTVKETLLSAGRT